MPIAVPSPFAGQARYEKHNPPLVIRVSILSIRKKEEPDGTRYALVNLEGNWETVKEGRMPLPEGYS